MGWLRWLRLLPAAIGALVQLVAARGDRTANRKEFTAITGAQDSLIEKLQKQVDSQAAMLSRLSSEVSVLSMGAFETAIELRECQAKHIEHDRERGQLLQRIAELEAEVGRLKGGGGIGVAA